jgi:hypothetical protein
MEQSGYLGWYESHFLSRKSVVYPDISFNISQLLAQHYHKFVQVIDYNWILPLLEDRSADMVRFCRCSPDVLFFTDDKPWEMARPGQGDAAAARTRAAGDDDVNLTGLLLWPS